ncbi:MAG: polymorphic toxin-type HINT domain-containing protein, partial [bacterium]|nr:polymorphic toxin-type HINT domain-containing protein [bacterium]
FRKTDASISVNTDKLMYLPGEKVKISFSGTAFLGQPLRNQDIRYKIYQYKADIGGDYSEVKFNTAEQYFSKELELTQGTVTLDKKGQATIDITAENGTGYRQFWIIETEYLDGSSTAANSAVRTLINPGDFVIDAERANLEFVQNVPVTFPFKLSKNKADADLSGAKISGKLLKSENNSYSVVLDSLQTTSDDDGRFSITFTPPSFGSYKLELETQDKKGNPIKDEQTFYVNKTQSDGQPVNIFTITPDKETYSVGDRAKINLKTSPGIRHIFVSVGREYSRDFRVLSVVNGQVSFEFEVKEKYQPNVFVYAGSFLGESWKSNYAKVSVDTSDKEVSIKITPAQQTYGPGATAQFDITATDGQGQPVETDLAFWVFDKALLELHGTYFDGIFKKFWDERSYSNTTNHSYAGISSSGAEGGGGCFAGDTLITMADGSKKRIDQVSQGDVIQTFNSASAKQHVSAKVTATHTVAVDGYLILNGTLKLTPEHILFVNDKWITAGEIRRGDTLIKADGAEVLVSSIEWVKGSFDVYNLTVEKFHTFFANDMYVHNDKGEARSTFKDTAYWNPHVSTDANGKASVTVPLPDNLTTWVAAAVSANAKTQVGIGTTEFIVTKDFVVRPIFPPFVRTGDTLNLSGLISNFTDARDSFSVEAKLTGGDISDTTQKISIDAKDIEEVIFPTKITGSNEDAIFSLKAQGKKKNDLIDEVTEKFPIYEYGSWQTHFAKGTDSIDFPLRMTLGTDSARLESGLDLKPSRYSELDEILRPMASGNLGGTIYGRGATLIAASILKQHGKQLGITFNQNELNEEVSEAVIALMSYQQEHGFWIDYNTNSIDIDATMFAMEALAIAQKAGYVVDQNLIESSLNYIAGQNAKNQEMDLLQQYVFALYPNQKRTPHAIDVSNSQDAEFVAKAAIANKRQGFVTSNQEENKLLELAHSSNTQLGWKIATEQTGNEKVFVLRPTAWATYAAQELEAPSIDVAKSLDYLFRNSQYVVEAQALQALATVKYFADTNQLPPNYSYRVLADQQVLTEGKVTSTQQVLQSIVLSPELFSSSATVVIEKTGAGQLISSLAQKEFFTERSHPEESHKLSIARKYLSTKPNGEATEVGDLIIVQFEITGLGLGEDNIELEDYLPSGLVAIDESLDNGEFDQSPASSTYASKQITDQGMLLNFSTWDANGTYSYKARVVSEGIFDTPPAVVRLKNDPSIWASTASETFVVDGKNALQSSTGMLKSSAGLDKIVAILLGILAGSLIMAFLYRERIKAFIQKRRDGQPTAEPPSDPQS